MTPVARQDIACQRLLRRIVALAFLPVGCVVHVSARASFEVELRLDFKQGRTRHAWKPGNLGDDIYLAVALDGGAVVRRLRAAITTPASGRPRRRKASIDKSVWLMVPSVERATRRMGRCNSAARSMT